MRKEKRGTRHNGYVRLLQEIFRQIGGISDRVVLERAAEELTDVGHQVKGAVRPNTVDAADAVQPFEQKISAKLKLMPHGLQADLRTVEGFDGGILGDG